MNIMLRRIIFIIISLITSYINCSVCSDNEDYNSYEKCLKLKVSDNSTQVCIRKSSTGKGCKETTLCTDVKLSTDEICSKLTVSKDKANTHICINHWDLDKCKETFVRKYGLPDVDDLLLLNELDLDDLSFFDKNMPNFFSYSMGAFLPIKDCEEHLICIEENLCTNVNYVNSDNKCSNLTVSKENLNTHVCIKNPEEGATNCIETNVCTKVKYGGTNEKCAKLTSKAGTKCIKDPSGEGCKETNDGSFLNIFYGLMILLFILIKS